MLREFRRRVFEEYGEKNLENPKNGEYFEYVYVDSSESDLNEGGRQWPPTSRLVKHKR